MTKRCKEMLEGTVEIIGVDTSALPAKKSSLKETKKNFETLMQPCGVLEADFALQQQFKTYSCKQLETVTNRIMQCVYNVTSNFLEIGFRLYECERYKYYSEAGYDSVCDYALSELGFKKSSTRNFIRVYERFCDHDIVKNAFKSEKYEIARGNYIILQQYKNFSYSQLTELLSLSDPQIEAIAPAPEDTVKDIRSKKQEFYEAAEKWLHDSIIEAVGGKLGFKKQIYEHYQENKSVGKLATLIAEHMLKIKSSGVIFEDGRSYCRFNRSRITFFHKLYYPEDKVMRWYDIAEKVVSYINNDTFLAEQVHIDEIAEELADEMIVTAPKNDIERSDEQRPYKIELYKDDIDIILKSLRAANVPQDTYERIYETIGKADLN
ncbi:MAG: hypothetical protein OSJ61_20600 [Lachnospiraceae bacterium]|nr:hypothetical protein [Lachnospiraceae bacterium]